MTILEALMAAIQVPGITTDTLKKACIDNGLIDTDTYSSSKEGNVDRAAISVLRSLVVSTEGEGDFRYSISHQAIQARISYLEGKLGIAEDGTPTVRAVSKW